MSAATGLGLLDLSILEAIEAAGAQHDRPYLKTQRVLDVLCERTGIAPNQAYESLCDLARPYAVHLQLVDFHGNYGSPDFGPASARYTECRLSPLGEAALAAERGELGPLPVALVNGDLHLGGRRPPFAPRRVLAAIRALADGAPDETIPELIGLPSFPSGCQVAGDAIAVASGGPSEIVTSATLVDGTSRERATVTITTLPPFSSASGIATRIQHAVDWHGRGLPGRPRSPGDDAPSPVSDVNDGSVSDRTALVVTGAIGASHAEVRRFLDGIHGVHQRIEVSIGAPLASLLRPFAEPSEDVERRLAILEQAIRT
jgi:DNA gyrase subunit A